MTPSPRQERLDPRAWLLWALAAGLPPLLGRNPLVLLAVLLACLGVRAVMVPDTVASASWRWMVRLAALFAVIGAVFNLLTVHIGDRPIARLPDAIPILGGTLTWNALVYGLLSGLAILVLVIIGVTLAACLDHAELLRLLPGRLTTAAVAGSVALAFLPQTVTAFHEIREAQTARGYRLRGARGLVPLIVPLLTGGLERALTLAEALESRGFGTELSDLRERFGGSARDLSPGRVESRSLGTSTCATTATDFRHLARDFTSILPSWSRTWRSVANALGLTACAASAYLLAVGNAAVGLLMLGLGLFGVVLSGWEPRDQRRRRTRYRHVTWSRTDSIVAIAAVVVLGVEIAVLKLDPAAFQFQPYPSFTVPHVNLWLLAALALLLAPAVVAPVAPIPEANSEDGLA